MTDNEKMREIWDAHDKARNKAWREEPGTFDTLDAFKAGAAWQAAKSVSEKESTVGDKMREAFDNCSLHDSYSNINQLEENREWFAAGWQAAQSVPVLGKPVAWKADNGQWAVDIENAERYEKRMAVKMHPLYKAPTTSITEAELERLRKDAERYRWLRDSPESPIINVGYATDKMVDAAIAGEKK